MRMKMILLGLVLLLVIVAVSYVKVSRLETRTAEAYQAGHAEASEKMADINELFDSALYVLEQQQVEAAESVLAREFAYRHTVDSLLETIVTKEQLVDSFQAALQRPAVSTTDSQSKDDRILSYYKARYLSLPKDLTDYERRVALTEIRQETARKFSISLKELKKLREANKLAY